MILVRTGGRYNVLMYKVILKKQATKYYQKVNIKMAKLLDLVFSELEETPHKGPNIKSLQGKLKGLWRYRLKGLRIVYEIIENDKEVNVILIMPRGDVYKKL